jgi:hypothetical protein
MQTNSTLFINVDYLRDNTVINGNVDSELLEPFIVAAQNVRIESIIGTGLFNNLVTNIDNGSITGSNKVLLDDYIQPCLIQWVVYEALPFINYKLTNKSVSTKGSDNSNSSNLNEIQYLRDNVRNTAEYMSQRVTDYLKSNTDLFPLYLSYGNTCDTIRPNSSNYFNGIFLDDDTNCNYGDGNGIPLNY